jgi:hypothetical protein
MKTGKLVGATLLMLVSIAAFGQSKAQLTDTELNEAGASRMLFASMVAGCEVADSLAKMDIGKKLPFLLLYGGIAPVAYMPTDAEVEQKFQFHYYKYGCSAPEEACVLGYNQLMFAYLTEKYGKKWVKAVRADVVGLKAWKRTH